MEISMSNVDYADMTAGDLAEQYLYYRDLKSQLKQKFEAKEAVLDAELDAITNSLMALCNEQDASSIRTDSGTIIRSIKVRYEPKDWDSMHEFILEHSAPYLLQKRVNESAMKEFLENNPSELPKGLNIVSEYKISVRKPTKK
jgi:ribonuclease HI